MNKRVINNWIQKGEREAAETEVTQVDETNFKIMLLNHPLNDHTPLTIILF